MGGRFKISDWLNSMKDTPGGRAPYFDAIQEQKGFNLHQDIRKRRASVKGNSQNRANFMYKASIAKMFQEADFSGGEDDKYHFTCPKGTHVSEGWYDPKNQYMKITFCKERSGAEGGVPPGTTTIYDHVPEYLFQVLKGYADRTGRCGEVFWDMVRVRGNPSVSQYMYTNQA